MHRFTASSFRPITEQVFLVNGKKLATLSLDEQSLKFSSSHAFTKEEFEKSWSKKLTLANQVEIKYAAIKSITKEDGEDELLIKYTAWAGIPSELTFSFEHPEDNSAFFSYLEKEQYFQKTYEKLLPWKAVQNYLIGLAATIFFTIFSYYEAIKIATGTVVQTHGSKTMLYNFIVGKLGKEGVVAIGACVGCYLLYIIRKRFKSPPFITRLLPPMHN